MDDPATVYVTHDQEEAMTIADRMAVFGDTLVRARIERRQRLREGDTVHLFDAQTRKRL